MPRDRTGQDSQNLGQDGPGQPKSVTGRGTKRDRAEKDILKQENDILKQKIWSFFDFSKIHFVPLKHYVKQVYAILISNVSTIWILDYFY